MSATAEQVLSDALALPDAGRIELIEALIASLQTLDDPPFDESWFEVARRRSAEIGSGAVQPIPWEQVKREAREKRGS